MSILRSIAAFIVGYLISLLSSIVWFNNLTRHDPSNPPSLRFLLATAVYGVVFALIAGFASAMIAGETARGVGRAIAFFILLVALWSWFETPGRSHWSQIVAIVLMTPAVLAGSALRTRSLPVVSPPAIRS